MTPAAALLDRVLVLDEPCWLALPHLVNPVTGYAKTGADVYLHRLAYELHVGPIPEGLEIDHLCRVRHCCNPAHLQAVTPRENVIRGLSPSALNAAKTHCRHGHEFTDVTTYRDPRGGRHCRPCMYATQAAYRARKARRAANTA